jgi:hypothetical protein
VRVQMVRAIEDAAAGVPAMDLVAAGVLGTTAAADAARLRATRAKRTDAGAASALGQLVRFVQVNEELAAGTSVLDDVAWDLVLEAFVTAKADPPTGHGWQRPREWAVTTPAGAGSAVGKASGALGRLGYTHGSMCRLAAARRSLGCGDAEDVEHAPPVFVWRVCAGIVALPKPLGAWDQCAVALIAAGALAAGRVGAVTAWAIEQVSLTADVRTIVVQPRARPKQHHARASGRARRKAQPIAISHWLVEVAIRPWILRLRSWSAPGTQLVFPSLVRHRSARVRTVNGRLVAGDMWMEPLKAWSPRATAAALSLVVGDGERFHGLRAGNNIELRRLKDNSHATSDVTRRVLHGRTVKDLIGSEVAYHEVFLEDLAGATSRLGELRIERVLDGLCVTASSTTQGERDDWHPTTRVIIPLADTVVDPSDSSGGEDEVGEAGSAFYGVVQCGRCRRHLSKGDHGYMCDAPGCVWGVCPTCHPAGERGELWCPKHVRRATNG